MPHKEDKSVPDHAVPERAGWIRSFVRREGRMTRSQRRALADLWPKYGIENALGPLVLSEGFGRSAPIVLDIGFGMGESLVTMAKLHPEHNYLGIDVYRPGVGSVLIQLEAQGLENVRLLSADAMDILQNRLAKGSVEEINLFFPDPWPKKRHHKRRLVRPEFTRLVRDALSAGGSINLATDWQDYAEVMLEIMGSQAGMKNTAGEGCYASRNTERPLTKFERRGKGKGHGVWDLQFEKTDTG